MAEFLILGAAVGTARLLQSLLVSREEQTPIYTLTPPAFDRIRNGSILTSTPLESFSHQRRRLFTCHYSLNDHSDNLFDVRLHMAPRQASEFHNDFSAHIYLPRSQPGQTLRPLAAAKFHLRHPRDENSFTNFVLRTDVGGNAFVNGAFSITNAIQRMRATPTIVNLTPSQVGSQLGIAVAATPQPPSTYTPLASTPRGVAMFFNLPIFGGTAPNQNAEFKPFEHRPALRMSTVVGMRLDDRTQDGRTGYSLGLHCDPIATLAHAQSGRTDAIQLGGWVSQETDQFRLVAESTIQPLRAGLKVPSGGDGASDSNPAGEGLSHHPVSAALPPRVAASLPALLNSRIGVFYTPARAGQLRPGYEVGFTLANDSKGKQELIASYFHHLVVRRNIKNPFEKKVRTQTHSCAHARILAYTRARMCNGVLTGLSVSPYCLIPHVCRFPGESRYQQLHRPRHGGCLSQ